MSIELEHRLVDLGAWLDQAAPEVRLGELARHDAPDDESRGVTVAEEDVVAPEVVVVPIAARRPRRRRPIALGAVAAAVVLVVGGLVAVSRRSGSNLPAEPTAPGGPESPTTTAASATLGTPWVALVGPLLPAGFTAVATLAGDGQQVAALDRFGRTITVSFGPGGAERAKQEWAGAGGIALTPGVAGGDGSSAAVITDAGDVVAATCWLGDDLCSGTALDPPVDVRPMLEALARSVTDANRPMIVALATPSTFDAAAAEAVSGRFITALGPDVTLATSGGAISRWSWIRPADVAQRVSLQIVPLEADVDIVDVARADLVTVSVKRDRTLYTAVARTTDGTPVLVSHDALRDLLTGALDRRPVPTTTAAPVPAAPVLPPLIDALLVPKEGIALTQTALQRLSASCMRAKGFTYDVAPYGGWDPGLGWTGEWFGPGLTVAQASASGYHQTADDDVAAEQRYQQAQDANTARARADEAYAKALDICALTANHAVYEDDDDPFLTLQTNTANALAGVFTPAADSTGYRQALDAWRACARTVGIDDDTPRPLLPFGTAVGAPPTAPATPDERERAVADATCREQAHLQDALRSSAVQLLDAWLADRPDLVERLRQGKARTIERAQRIVADTAATLQTLGIVTLPDGTRAGVGVSDTAFCLLAGDGTVGGCDGAPASLSPGYVMAAAQGSGPQQLVYGVTDAGLTATVTSGGVNVTVVQSAEPVAGHVVFMAVVPPGTRVDVELRRGSELVKRFADVPH